MKDHVYRSFFTKESVIVSISYGFDVKLKPTIQNKQTQKHAAHTQLHRRKNEEFFFEKKKKL